MSNTVKLNNCPKCGAPIPAEAPVIHAIGLAFIYTIFECVKIIEYLSRVCYFYPIIETTI